MPRKRTKHINPEANKPLRQAGKHILLGELALALEQYLKIHKLEPQDITAMTTIADLLSRLGNIATFQEICDLDPTSHQSWLELAQALEKFGKLEEANRAYLECADLLAKKGNTTLAVCVVENIFRLKPRNKEFIKSFFELLQKINLGQRGIEYLQSLSIDQDPDLKLILGEYFLQAGNFEVPPACLLEAIRRNPKMVPAALRLLQEFITRNDLDASLDVVDALFEASMQLQDEMTLKIMLDSLLELDKSNIRTLKALTTLLIRINDQLTLEEYLKQLAILQLRRGNIQEARDSFNKMLIYGQNSAYVNMLNLLNDATVMGSPQHLKETCQAVIRALQRGSLEGADSIADMELVSGGSDLDLGLAFEWKRTF